MRLAVVKWSTPPSASVEADEPETVRDARRQDGASYNERARKSLRLRCRQFLGGKRSGLTRTQLWSILCAAACRGGSSPEEDDKYIRATVTGGRVRDG